MSIVQEKKLLADVIYTICPTLVASHVAVEKGWLQEEFDAQGVSLKFLRSLPKPQWLPHFNHKLDNLFRDGGNIPPIWAKAEGQDTKLIGLSTRVKAGQLAVLASSSIQSVADLKGKKIGLSKRATNDRVDFSRATAHRTILLSLEYAGVQRKDVSIVDAEESPSSVGDPSWELLNPASKPTELWADSKFHESVSVDAQALLDGKVDAIPAGRTKKLEQEGKVRIISSLASSGKAPLDPSTITVNTKLAQDHPEVIIGYLKAAIKAGRWINSNPAEAAKIFVKVTNFKDVSDLAAKISKLDFVPNLSADNVKGIELEKEFLLAEGYIKADFNVSQWADPSYLTAALRG
jgi:ABC-type nitrate/sulfonate/bicarbonate transport system substrate-binding protein